MSDSYNVGAVTVTPSGGGWYEITHASLDEPIKEQGKENADAKAKELDDSLKSGSEAPGGSMQGQGPLDDAAAAADLAEKQKAADEEAKAKEDLETEVETLRRQLKEQADARNEAEARATKAEATIETLQTKTVKTDNGEVPEPVRVPASAPRVYDGVLDEDVKASLEKVGVKVIRIVLEENENIPPTGLYVGHNGIGYMIVPGEEVDVPDFLLGVLDDAVMSAPVVDSKSQKVLGYRNRSRYPYRRVQ